MKAINVEEIMAEIRQDIIDKGYTPEMLSFRDVNASYIGAVDFNPDEFRYMVGALEATKYVPWKQENIGTGVKGFIKKVVRKLVGFVVAPMSDGQNLYNQQVASAFAQLLGYIESQNRLIEEYEDVLKSLKDNQKTAEE